METDRRVEIINEWFVKVSGNPSAPLVITSGEINDAVMEGWPRICDLVRQGKVKNVVVQTVKDLGSDLQSRYELMRFFLAHGINIWVWNINRKLDLFNQSDRKMIGVENLFEREVREDATR